MRGNKQGTKGEQRKMTMKQYPFCEINFFFCFAAFLRLLFQTTWSCDWRGLSIYCFPLIWGGSGCQRTGSKANFLLDLGLASNREKEIWTRLSVDRDPTHAQRSWEVAEQKQKGQGPRCSTWVWQRSARGASSPGSWTFCRVLVEHSQPTWSHLNHATGLLPL